MRDAKKWAWVFILNSSLRLREKEAKADKKIAPGNFKFKDLLVTKRRVIIKTARIPIACISSLYQTRVRGKTFMKSFGLSKSSF